VPRFIRPGLIYTGAALESPKKGGWSFVLAIKKEPATLSIHPALFPFRFCVRMDAAERSETKCCGI